MPIPLSPPYNIYQPRTLNRWLDKNSQNGPLGRCQTFIVIPPFDIPVEWNGYSQIVIAFSYQSPNAFSLMAQSGFSVPVNLPFVLCISYVNADGTVARYALNDISNGTFYFQLDTYFNQMIKRNFRIEVWSIPTDALMSESITLYTSVKQNIDTRFGIDIALTPISVVDTNFYTQDMSLPYVFPDTLNIN
jgi:hypothetical protein